jgi:hypothetical protein
VPLPEDFTELVELLPGLTTENVRETGVTWDELGRFRGHDKAVWLAPNVYVMFSRYFNGGRDPLVLYLGSSDGIFSMHVHVTLGTATAAAAATCDFLLCLVATCDRRDVCIQGSNGKTSPRPISGEAIPLFFQEGRSCLRQVTLRNMTLNEDLCHALATMSRLDVELDMFDCSLSNDAADVFFESLQSDRGPVKLRECKIDSRILANALTRDSCVTKLQLDYRRTIDADMAILFTALANNRGLVDLGLCGSSTSDDNWAILCDSLKGCILL